MTNNWLKWFAFAQAVLNPNYFLAAVELCERNLTMARSSILELLAALQTEEAAGAPGEGLNSSLFTA